VRRRTSREETEDSEDDEGPRLRSRRRSSLNDEECGHCDVLLKKIMVQSNR